MHKYASGIGEGRQDPCPKGSWWLQARTQRKWYPLQCHPSAAAIQTLLWRRKQCNVFSKWLFPIHISHLDKNETNTTASLLTYLRECSSSLCERLRHKESTSSKNMMAWLFCFRTCWNRSRISLQEQEIKGWILLLPWIYACFTCNFSLAPTAVVYFIKLQLFLSWIYLLH